MYNEVALAEIAHSLSRREKEVLLAADDMDQATAELIVVRAYPSSSSSSSSFVVFTDCTQPHSLALWTPLVFPTPSPITWCRTRSRRM